jgi:hypothetical protein
LFRRAAKILDCEQKRFFCSVAQRKTLEFTNKSNSNQLYRVLAPKSQFSRAAKSFRIANRHLYFVFAQRNFLELTNKRNSFGSAVQRKVLELPTKETQMNCLQLSREEKVDLWKQ